MPLRVTLVQNIMNIMITLNVSILMFHFCYNFVTHISTLSQGYLFKGPANFVVPPLFNAYVLIL